MLPYAVLQSRGGDNSSLGGITSATTAFGNNDGISHENRSGHSIHDNSNNHSGGNYNNNYSYSGNGIFNGDQSHKSISDKESMMIKTKKGSVVPSPNKESTPTQSAAEVPKQISTHLTITNKDRDVHQYEDEEG